MARADPPSCCRISTSILAKPTSSEDHEEHRREEIGEQKQSEGEGATAGAELPTRGVSPRPRGRPRTRPRTPPNSGDGENDPGSSGMTTPCRPGRPLAELRAAARRYRGLTAAFSFASTRSSKPISCAMPTSCRGCANLLDQQWRICRRHCCGSPNRGSAS